MKNNADIYRVVIYIASVTRSTVVGERQNRTEGNPLIGIIYLIHGNP